MIDITLMKVIAVTGATGFVADSLIQRLVDLGVKVHAIARNEGDLTNLKLKYPDIDIFPCPIEDEYLLRKAFSWQCFLFPKVSLSCIRSIN